MWRGRARPVQQTPLLWLALCCEEWGCPRDLAERSWQTLMTSRWSAATALRQWVLAQPFVDVAHVRRRYPPHELVGVLEALVQERRLPRREATTLEDHLLTAVAADGDWHMKGQPYVAT
jgi:hypothetical protein